MIQRSTILALVALKIKDANGHLELFPESAYHRGCAYVSTKILGQFRQEQDDIFRIVGEAVKTADAVLASLPFDKFHKGARDTAVNLMTALRVARFYSKPPEPPTPEIKESNEEPIDRTKF